MVLIVAGDPTRHVDLIFDFVLAILSRVDRHPGRLYSFVCRKPVLAS